MKNTYAKMLVVHRWAAFVLAVFIAMYAITGIVIVFPSVIPDRWATIETFSDVSVEVPGLPDATAAASLTDDDLRDVAAIVAGELALRGRLDTLADVDGAKQFGFLRPGTLETVVWEPGSSSVRLTIQGGSLRTTLNRLHHLDGYRGGPKFWLWALMVDIVSLSMLAFAGTGVYLWYVRKQKDRRLGWVVLVGSTVFTVGSTLFLVFGR